MVGLDGVRLDTATTYRVPKALFVANNADADQTSDEPDERRDKGKQDRACHAPTTHNPRPSLGSSSTRR
jgi:hypothetical protein